MDAEIAVGGLQLRTPTVCWRLYNRPFALVVLWDCHARLFIWPSSFRDLVEEANSSFPVRRLVRLAARLPRFLMQNGAWLTSTHSGAGEPKLPTTSTSHGFTPISVVVAVRSMVSVFGWMLGMVDHKDL